MNRAQQGGDATASPLCVNMDCGNKGDKVMDEIQVQRQQILDLLKKIINLGETLFDEKLSKGELKNDNEYNLPLLIIYFKSIKTGKAIHLLCSENFGEDAGNLARSLLESIINFNYLTKEPKKYGLLYRRYAVVERLTTHELIRNIAANLGEDSFDWMVDETAYKEAFKELEEKLCQTDIHYDKKKQKEFDNIHRWSGKSLREMAKDDEFEQVYHTFSGYVHPSPEWIIKFAAGKGDEIILDLRTKEEVMRPLISYVAISLLDLVREANKFFSLTKDGPINELLDEFHKIDPITIEGLSKLKEFAWLANPKIRDKIVLRLV